MKPLWIVMGSAGIAISMAATGIEGWRNFSYGLERGNVYAFGFLLFAVGIIVTQMLARHMGWLQMAPALAVCVLITMWCGIGFYSDAITLAIQTTESHGEAVADARHDLRELDAEVSEKQARLTKITETATAASLKTARDDALRRMAEESTELRGGCKPWIVKDGRRIESECKRAEREAEDYARRLIEAEARESIEAALSTLRGRRDSAKTVQASAAPGGGGTAALMSWGLGGDAAAYRRRIALIEPFAIVVGQLILAGLFTPSMMVLVMGLGREPVPAPVVEQQAKPARKRSAPQPQPTAEPATTPPPEPARKPTLDEKQLAGERLAQFIAERLTPGSQWTQFAPIHEDFRHWWRAKFGGIPAPDHTALGKAMVQAGIGKTRKTAGMMYAATLTRKPMVVVA